MFRMDFVGLERGRPDNWGTQMVRVDKFRVGTLALAFALAASACSGGSSADDEVSDSPTTTSTVAATSTTEQSADDLFGGETTDTTTPDLDPCADLTPEATDTGVSADTITVLVAADVNSPLAPGLFKDSWVGVKAWADHVNANGGLACRQVEVIEFDTLLNANESANAQITACENALAMVGTTALFVLDTAILNTCPDASGNPVGIPDIAQLTTEVAHQCSVNTFPVVEPQGACPYAGGPRVFTERVGEIRWFQENIDPDLTAVFIVPGDLPSTRQASITTIRAMEQAGVDNVAEFAVGGFDLQPVYTPFVQAITDNSANMARTGSNDQSLVKWRSEAVAQGVEAEIWVCTIACYSQSIFEAGGDVIDGTYVTIFTIPFEEADTNPELQAYVDSVSNPSAFGLNSWASGVMLEDAVNSIVDSDGINAITRQTLLEQMSTITAFDAHGMLGTVNPAGKVSGPCYVMLQIQDGAFVRVHPDDRGTFDCDPSNFATVTLDAAAESDKLG